MSLQNDKVIIINQSIALRGILEIEDVLCQIIGTMVRFYRGLAMQTSQAEVIKMGEVHD